MATHPAITALGRSLAYGGSQRAKRALVKASAKNTPGAKGALAWGLKEWAKRRPRALANWKNLGRAYAYRGSQSALTKLVAGATKELDGARGALIWAKREWAKRVARKKAQKQKAARALAIRLAKRKEAADAAKELAARELVKPELPSVEDKYVEDDYYPEDEYAEDEYYPEDEYYGDEESYAPDAQSPSMVGYYA